MIGSDFLEYLLFDADKIDTDATTGLWFCADPVDMMAIADEGGNAVSLHLTGEWGDIDSCGAFFEAFRFIVVAHPDQDTRKKVVRQIRERFPVLPMVEIESGYRDMANMAGFVRKYGVAVMHDLLAYGKDIPARGLLDLADVERPPKTDPILSGVSKLDRAIGGFSPGELTVWTGKRGEGKSSIAGQVLLSAMNQGYNVFAYSGELPAWRFREWIFLNAAGPQHVQDAIDHNSQRPYSFVNSAIGYFIGEWMRGHFFLYDSSQPNANNPNDIFAIMDYAYKRRGCKVFMLDNLMSVELPDQEYFRAQSRFVGKAVEFAKRTQTHVHLVAHPRKTRDGAAFSTDDVGGSGDITNRADNTLLIERLPEDEAKKQGIDVRLSVLKNRSYGAKAKIGLRYEPRSRRFYTVDSDPNWQYKWEDTDMWWNPDKNAVIEEFK